MFVIKTDLNINVLDSRYQSNSMFGASVTWLDNEQFLSCEPRYTQYFDCYYEPSLCRSKDAMKCTQCVLHESDPSLKGFNKRVSTFNNLALLRICPSFDYTSLSRTGV